MSAIDPAIQELHSLRDFIRLGVSRFRRAGLFYGHGTDNAWDEAVQLVLFAAGLPWDVSPEALDARLLNSEKQQLLDLFQRRIKERIPAPYLIGEAWFCDMPFHVDERVLIPRSPIAQLIKQGFAPWLDGVEVERVLDLCTGSGCIGLACSQLFEKAQVDLLDLSDDALAVCCSNIERHGLQSRARALQSDLFDSLEPRQQYQLIVSNPPYVDQQDFDSMPAEYQHEPELGLVSGADGLDICYRILAQAGDYLSDDGLLVVEVGNSEVALCQQLPDAPFIWAELPEGGNGIFMITAYDLRQLAATLKPETGR
ncbi:50S ribosomal protein L3 N(5)-glutamine methyltransferase [Motiliproteus coralliicola]|uniref:Ribosomal protein uL3 glutamine methyltransferase n=1 Tax=Motiliproteus coralliicola TaxID=2283196 RepID=A0A369WV90_9GAMM|nr:50S ribosomal protein L3 N(5)-glutamine methyltransferase [Motiliproteus coralliicola]RDE24456.1 50S ribosomal protein L3 N(5)-glutamine methyltransferase [Motiliproteus coralliicola]